MILLRVLSGSRNSTPNACGIPHLLAGALLLLLVALPACSPPAVDGSDGTDRADAPGATWVRSPDAYNILFIGIDDLATTTGFYGFEDAITPNLDRLASRSLVFDRAYVQMAKCSASRASLLSGCRPATTRVTGKPYSEYFKNSFLQRYPTLPEYFERHGFVARTFGKVHHGFKDRLAEPHIMKYPRPPYYALPENSSVLAREDKRGNLALFEFAEADEDGYPDAQIAHAAMAALRDTASHDSPFFFAVGFSQPHLPWVTPKKYRDLYRGPGAPRARLTPHPETAPPYAAMEEGLSRFTLPSSFDELSKQERADEMLRAYLAGVSFVDAQVGKLLDEVDRLGIGQHTVIVLWSDHGYHLGTHGMWGKRTNYEDATRAPLMISVPDMDTAGRRSGALVEFVDLFPTLADLAGLPVPEHLEGTSFVPLIRRPDAPWKSGAFSLVRRHDAEGDGGIYEGYALRTSRHRYVEWWEMTGHERVRLHAQELYDLETDPGELKNLANESDAASLVTALSDQLWAGWEAARPAPELSPASSDAIE